MAAIAANRSRRPQAPRYRFRSRQAGRRARPPDCPEAQESRAEDSLEALKQMLVTTATVRRDGRTDRVDAAELVPGDVVMVEAGDRIPADGRLFSSTSLEVQESSLTGEAQPAASPPPPK